MTNRRGRRNSKTTSSIGKGVKPSGDFSQMRLRFYIVRPDPNKKCVPMVALDELPTGFHLKGVPLSVTPQQIQEWDMARVGADIELTDSFEVDFDCSTPPQSSQHFGPDKRNQSLSEKPELSNKAVKKTPTADEEGDSETVSKPNITTYDKPGKLEAAEVKPTERYWRPTPELQQAANEAAKEFVEQSRWEKENDPSKTQDAATPGIYGKKKFCTHWIRTGNCDYMQEGCRYLHVIPDAETRLRIGIRDMPRWAKEDLPSPPRETYRSRRHSSTPPRETGKDTHKDWRSRGNRKAHAELPTSRPLTQRPASMRLSTPTPPIIGHDRQQTLLRGSTQPQMDQPVETTHVDLLAAQLAGVSAYGGTTSELVPHNPQSVYHNITDPYPIQSATAADTQRTAQKNSQRASAIRDSFMRQQRFTPLLANSTPLPTLTPHSPLRQATSPQSHISFNHGPSSLNASYSGFCPLQLPLGPNFSSEEISLDDGRWGFSSHQHQSTTGSQNSQPLVTPGIGPFTSSPWIHHGSPNSRTPSFSASSIGPIGHGRPTNSDLDPSTPTIGSPIMHKRLFRQPGESQYVQAEPEPKAKRKASGRFDTHKSKAMTAFEMQNVDGGLSGDLGNLITLDG